MSWIHAAVLMKQQNSPGILRYRIKWHVISRRPCENGERQTLALASVKVPEYQVPVCLFSEFHGSRRQNKNL